MKTKPFTKLLEPIDRDPRRRANVDRHRVKTLAEIAAHSAGEGRSTRTEPNRNKTA